MVAQGLPPASPPRGEQEIFPAWIRERKDFQVFFPRFSDIVITDDEILRQGVPKDPGDRNIVELQCLARWIMKIPSMATSLDLSQATEIAKLARYQALKPREYVFHKGDKGDACYLVFSGEVHVLIDDQKVATVGKNSAFGDIALQIENATRGADVQAGTGANVPVNTSVSTAPANNASTATSTPTQLPSAPAIGVEVLKIMAEDYHKTLARCQTRRRKHLINWLHTEVLLFRDCVESKLHYFELVSLDVPLKQGEILYRQGDSIGAFYVVRSGKVRLEVDIQYEHKHRWPVGKHEWKEQVHAAKSRVPFALEERAGFFGFEMFVEGQQTRAYTVIADSPTVELVGLNRVDCFSPYFSFTPRAIERILEKHDKCRELATKQIHQKLKDFRRFTSAQKKAFNTTVEKEAPVSVKAKFNHSKETPQFQFPSLQPAKWEAPNDVVRALQLACQ
uniref:Cyclic nucleotide-binding domain-containing protein n=1 Tax=Globisporangium ultimum (strain ATCC 200006 / CBS 805.95 / DAOM BR144) TaxID=431595 RepID=K3WN52_GLOUD